ARQGTRVRAARDRPGREGACGGRPRPLLAVHGRYRRRALPAPPARRRRALPDYGAVRPRYGRAPVRMSRNALLGIYYLGVFAMIAVGASLWLTGHGTGDPWLSLGVLLAFAPPVVIWLRRLFSRD